MSSTTTRLNRYRLDTEFSDNSVTHRIIQSDLVKGRRRFEVLTTWVHERKLGAGAYGEVSLQREKSSGELRAVKAISKTQLRRHEMDALIDLQDVCARWWARNECAVWWLTRTASRSLRLLSWLVRGPVYGASRDGVYLERRPRSVSHGLFSQGPVGSKSDHDPNS